VPGYVDLHNHILFGVDDGAPDLADSLAMLRRFSELGYTDIALTPHIKTAFWENTRDELTPRLHRLREAAAADGLGDLRLELGAEHFVDARFFDLLEHGGVIPIGESGHILVELPGEGTPPALEQMLFQIQLAGLTPILAHPERYADLAKTPDRLRRVQDRGTLLQISLTSLAKKFGRRLRKTAVKLIKAGLCDLVSTDAHSPDGMERFVAPGLKELRKLVGEPKAERLLSTVPRRILDS